MIVRLDKSCFALLAVTLLGGSVVSCQQQRQVYQVNGVVEQIIPERKKVRIAHETIPSYMEAMAMEFDVKSTNELAGLQAGDIVTFRMIVTADVGWIEGLKKVGTAPLRTNVAPATTRIVKDVEELKVGDLLPEYVFTNQFGRVIRTSDFRGQALAFTFIFTRCPFPVYCPRMSTNFSQVQAQLKALPRGPTNWHLLTLSFDPAHDTPEVLRSYAERYGYDPEHWTFASGDLTEITALGDHFGLLFWWSNPANRADISHNVRTVIVDTRGRVQKIYPDNEWKVDEVVADMVKAAQIER